LDAREGAEMSRWDGGLMVLNSLPAMLVWQL
jgi:hypothetical protein